MISGIDKMFPAMNPSVQQPQKTNTKTYDVYKNWWQGKTMEEAYKCMKDKKCPKEVIIKVLMDFDGATQLKVGQLFYEKPEEKNSTSIERLVRKYIKSKKYEINFIDKIK